MDETYAMCLLNIMKVLHHASSDESNGCALERLIDWLMPFLGDPLYPNGKPAKAAADPSTQQSIRRATVVCPPSPPTSTGWHE